MTDRERIAEIEKQLDDANAKYGNEKELCIFCHAKEYDSKVGINHFPDCIILILRNYTRQPKPLQDKVEAVAKWLKINAKSDPFFRKDIPETHWEWIAREILSLFPEYKPVELEVLERIINESLGMCSERSP